MFGPFFVIFAFIICFFFSSLACRFAGKCEPLEFGRNATIVAIVFIIVIYIFKNQLGLQSP